MPILCRGNHRSHVITRNYRTYRKFKWFSLNESLSYIKKLKSEALVRGCRLHDGGLPDGSRAETLATLSRTDAGVASFRSRTLSTRERLFLYLPPSLSQF